MRRMVPMIRTSVIVATMLAVAWSFGTSQAHVTGGHVYVGVFVKTSAPISLTPVIVRAQNLTEGATGQVKMGSVTVKLSCLVEEQPIYVLGHVFRTIGDGSDGHYYGFTIIDVDKGTDILSVSDTTGVLPQTCDYNHEAPTQLTGVGVALG